MVPRDLEFCIFLVTILCWLGILIVIGLEASMIGKALPNICFIWGQVQFHGHPRSNLLFLNL